MKTETVTPISCRLSRRHLAAATAGGAHGGQPEAGVTAFSFNLKFLSAALFVFLCFSAFAETAKAQIVSGAVADEQNAPIQNAEATLSANNKIVSRATTDAEGRFILSADGTGNLILRVQAASFAPFEQQLKSDLQTPLAIVLKPVNLRENVTISITRTEARLGETPSSVIVLNRETLDAAAALTVDDALRQVPGFSTFRRTSSRTTNPTAQGANLRGVGGSGASRTAVLLDGTSLNDAFGGWTYWTRVPRAAVEQVEVLRGGASALYGTAALSGAINVLTARPENEKPVLRLETSLGTQKTIDGSLFAAFARKGWAASLAAESFNTGGYIPVDERERGAVDAEANSRHRSLFLTVERRFGENSRIFARGNVFSEQRDNGTILQKNRTGFRQLALGGDLNNVELGAFSLRSFVETQVYDQTFSAVSADRNSESLTRVQRVPSQAVGASLFWSGAATKAHAVSAGFEVRQVRGFSDETIYNAGRATTLVGAGGRELTFGVFGQDFWRVNSRLNLNFGARFDRWRESNALSTTQSLTGNRQPTVVNFPARTESAFSPQIGALYQINRSFSVAASVNRSFRAPTLNELYRAFRVGNVLTEANAGLRAERAANGEAGINFSGFDQRFNLRATAFLTTVSRPVVNVTISATPNLIVRRRQNLGATRSQGVEIDSEVKLSPDLTVSAGYVFADSRITDFPIDVSLVKRFLPQIARHQFTTQIVFRRRRFSFGAQARAVGGQFEDDQNSLRLRPFFALDATAAYRFPKNLEIFVAAENLTNSRYDIGRTPVRTVAAPAFVRVGLRFSF